MNNNNLVKWYFTFYKRGTQKTSLQENHSQEEIDRGFLVARDYCNKCAKKTTKQFALFRDWSHFQQHCETQENRNFYEAIQCHEAQKLKFDLENDNVAQAEQDFPLVLRAIHDTFEELFDIVLTQNMVICNSHGPAKRSWHIIINGYYVQNTLQAEEFYRRVSARAPKTRTSNGQLSLDPNVYHKFQLFRLLGSSKMSDATRVKKLDPQSLKFEFEDTLITYIDECDPLPEIPVVEKVAPPAAVPCNNINKSEPEVEAIVARLSAARWEDRASWVRIGMGIKTELGETGLSLWKKYSRKYYQNYDEADHDNTWNSFNRERNGAIITTIGTLIQWANEDDTKVVFSGFSDDNFVVETTPKNMYTTPPDNICSDMNELASTMKVESHSCNIQVPNDNIHETKPPIYQKGTYFGDIRLLMARQVTDAGEIKRFVTSTVAFIINGGNSFYLTKNEEHSDIKYTSTTAKDLAQYSFNKRTPAKPVLIDPNDKEALKQMIKEKKQKTKVSLIELLLPYQHEIMYDRVVFEPYTQYSDFVERTNGKSVFNLFTGFHAQPNSEPIEYPIIAPLLWHMQHILCAGNDNAFEYMLNWLAHLCQKPNRKIGVMVALMSTHQGAGKNIFWDFVGNHIVGRTHYMVLNDLDQLTGKFNSVVENKLLTVCDEIGNFGGAHRSNDKLKNIITQGEQIIERKGFDSIRVNDYNNFVGLSNNDWPWKIECGDRRHLVLEVSNEKVGDKHYFTQLAQCFNDECGTHFYNMLLQRNITKWNPIDIPVTQYKRDLKLMSAPPAIRYMIECVRSDDPRGFSWHKEEPTHVFSAVLYTEFQQWQRDAGDDRDKISLAQFVRSLGRIGMQTQNITIYGVQKKGFVLDKNDIIANIRTFLKDEHL